MKKLIALGILGMLILLAAPVALIWAFNTLFGLSIVLTLKTYLAALVLIIVFGSK